MVTDRVRRTLRETLLWVGAVLGVLCAVWTVAVLALGLTPLVFTSGSMSPEIRAGDLGVARTVPVRDVAVGDVVSVLNNEGTRITHRVVSTSAEGGVTSLVLKGDANATSDNETYRPEEVQRVWFSVPKAGHVVDAVGSPVGMFVGGLLVAGALFVGFSGPRSPRPGGRRRASGRGESAAGARGAARTKATVALAGVVGLLLVGGVASGPGALTTQAAFTDKGTMTTGTLATSTNSCRVTNGSNTYPCTVNSITATEYNLLGHYREYQVTFTTTGAPYGSTLWYAVDLSTMPSGNLTDLTSLAWPTGWATTGTRNSLSTSATPVSGYQCSQLPVFVGTDTTGLFGSSTSSITVVANRSGWTGINCA